MEHRAFFNQAELFDMIVQLGDKNNVIMWSLLFLYITI